MTVQEQINSEDTDFKPLLRSIAETDPDVLYAPVFVAACSLILKQALDIMPDVQIMASDGCAGSDTIKTAGAAAIEGVAVVPRHIGVQGGRLLRERLPAGVRGAVRIEPTSVFHAHAFDATGVLFDAIEQVAVENDDGSLSIPRTALRDAVFATSGYEGLTGIITCTEAGRLRDRRDDRHLRWAELARRRGAKATASPSTPTPSRWTKSSNRYRSHEGVGRRFAAFASARGCGCARVRSGFRRR